MSIDPAILAELVAKLNAAHSRKQRGSVIEHYARLCRLSVAQLRRIARSKGVVFGYARRKDAGTLRDAAATEAAEVVATVIVKSMGDMPTWKAIEVCEAQGLIAAGSVKAHFVDRYIRDHKIDRKPCDTPGATRKIKWGEVGEVMQIDSTNCQQWFFMEKDGSIRATRKGEVYHNKPSKAPPIIRYVASDPVSGLFRVKYYQTDGESAQVTLDFLFWAMSRDEQPQYMPMAGVPKVLVMDGGPGNRSAAVKNLCEELGIEHRTHAPHHAWAKGSVENAMILWQRAFESELRIWPAANIDELNDRATQSLYKFMATRIHTRHNMTRSAFYAEQIAARGIVPVPPYEQFVEAATTARVEREVVGGSLISYEGETYYAGGLAGVKTRDKVLVAKAVLAWNETDKPVRIYFGDQCVVEKALAKDDRGNYTDSRVYEKRVDAALDAEQQQREIRLAAPVPAAAPAVAMEKLPTFDVPKARMVVRPAPSVVTKRREMALLELSDRVGRELNEFEINALGWGEAVAVSQIEAAVAALSRPSTSDGRAAMA